MSGDEETTEFLSTHEVWRDVQGYEGLYQVSSFGRVRGLDRVVTMKNGRKKSIKGRILKTRDNGHGYVAVTLRKQNNPRVFYVHRLVANAFLENTEHYPEVNHKDEIKHHNNVINLEWCDHAYNNTYGTKIARTIAHTDYAKRAAPSKEGIRNRTIARSRLINIYDRETGQYYGSGFAKQLAPILGLARTTITSYANGDSQNVALIMKYNDEDARKSTFSLTYLPKHLTRERLRMYRPPRSKKLTLEELEIVCYDSLSRQLSVFHSIQEAAKQTGVLSYKIKNGLVHKANGTKRYVFARHTSNYMEVLQQKYQKMKNKPIDVYSSDGKFMFSDFNYNLAKYFSVYVDYINKVTRDEYKSVKGYRLEKMSFSPANTLED